MGEKWIHTVQNAATIVLLLYLLNIGLVLVGLIFAGLLVLDYLIGFVDYKCGLSRAELESDYVQFNPIVDIVLEGVEKIIEKHFTEENIVYN